MSDIETYEFSSAFRGESYEWFPREPDQARRWHALLVHCLRNQVRDVTLEAADGQRWAIVWTPKNRNQVRGGSLQITALPDRPPVALTAVDSPLILRTAVALLSEAGPARLTPELWHAITDPSSELAQYLDEIRLPAPTFAVQVEAAAVRRQLDELGAQPDLAILAPRASDPSPAGLLLIDWLAGGSWLAERVQEPRTPATELLGPSQRTALLDSLAQIVACSSEPVVGWDRVERTLSLFEDVAKRWTGATPRWEPLLVADAREPKLDAHAGIVEIPGDGDARRARKLHERIAGPTSAPEPAAARESARLNGRLVSVAVVAFALGLLVGFVCAYLWMMSSQT